MQPEVTFPVLADWLSHGEKRHKRDQQIQQRRKEIIFHIDSFKQTIAFTLYIDSPLHFDGRSF